MATQTIGPTSLAAVNATIVLDPGLPMATHSIIVQGTYTGLTLIVESSADGGTTWIPMKLTQTSTSGTVASDVVSANGHYSMSSGVVCQMFRARATAIASGAALVTIMAASGI